MIITTTPNIEGMRIDTYLGLASGEAIYGANLLRDLLAGVRDIVGGRAGAYEKVLRDAKDAAIADMTEQAREWGADAIVGISLDYEVVGGKGSMLMVVATGTAVTAKKAKEDPGAAAA